MSKFYINSVPLVILSSDKYSDVLLDLLAHIRKNVKMPMKVYYSVNSIDCAQKIAAFFNYDTAHSHGKHKAQFVHFHPLYSGQEDWTMTLRSAVSALLSYGYEKALFVLEDFFVTSVSQTLILEAAQIDADIVYVSYRPRAMSALHACSKNSTLQALSAQMSIFRVSPLFKYGISLQPAIWSLLKLLEYIDEVKPLTPWDFERPYRGTVIREVLRIRRPAYLYRDQSVEKGRWFPLKALLYRKYSRRPLMSPVFYIQVLFRTALAKVVDSAFDILALLKVEPPLRR